MTPHVSTTLLRTQTDERLIELIAAGHDRAFDAVVDRYRRPLLRYARRFLHEEARAEDVVQAAFISAWAALREGKPVRDLRPWLYRIVHNGAVNVMKKPGGEDVPLIEASDLRPGPALEVEQREDVRVALDTIAALPERQRAALLAIAFDGRSHADVGEELGLKEPAVRQLVSRARRSLRVAATALTPWPAAVWLAGIGSSQAGEAATRIGEIAGGVGAGTLFGGGAMKAGALVAAAGAVAVSAPQMAEVVHHRHRPVATATASAASTRSLDGDRSAGPAKTVLVSSSADRLSGAPSERLTALAPGGRHVSGPATGSGGHASNPASGGFGGGGDGDDAGTGSAGAPQTETEDSRSGDSHGVEHKRKSSEHRRSGSDETSDDSRQSVSREDDGGSDSSAETKVERSHRRERHHSSESTTAPTSTASDDHEERPESSDTSTSTEKVDEPEHVEREDSHSSDDQPATGDSPAVQPPS